MAGGKSAVSHTHKRVEDLPLPFVEMRCGYRLSHGRGAVSLRRYDISAYADECAVKHRATHRVQTEGNEDAMLRSFPCHID